MPSKGSNQKKCKHYRDMGRKAENKRKKLEKHLKKFPNDKDAKQALKDL